MPREGSLDAPTRHPLGQDEPEFWDPAKLQDELTRVFDICHGCRRCFNLCESFPTLFDLIDETDSLELEDVDPVRYNDVVGHCFQCDMCYQTKCPYVPPHEWNVDFPHLMLRAKAIEFKAGKSKLRDRLITSTDRVGSLATIPGVAPIVNAANKMPLARKLLDNILEIHPESELPIYHSRTLTRRVGARASDVVPEAAGSTTGKVALFATCYGDYNAPEIGEDLIRVFEHNGIRVELIRDASCCGMPKFELGDLDSVARLAEHNMPLLQGKVDDGWDLITLIPSCTLMFKQELPLMFPDDEAVAAMARAMFDPFEYLMLRHREGRMNLEFNQPLGKVAWQVACHQRVQNIGPKTREILELVPGTSVVAIERCSGHDGTYTVKTEKHEAAMKILKPVVNRVKQADADYYTSDCVMAGKHIGQGLGDSSEPTHPLSLLRKAYGI
jgi:glycerol-3-phosphate dehydrogenase subunit C